ncbi:MAG: sensor histidine kinase, partial [Asticcacaulis sp.]
ASRPGGHSRAASSGAAHTAGAASAPRRVRLSNLKVEVAVFLLIALTFVAVLGERAVTGHQYILDAKAQVYPYVYSDRDNGGGTTAVMDRGKPLTWSCDLATAPGAYCGYGLSLAPGNSSKGADLSNYQDITIRLTYHGAAQHMKLLLKTALDQPLRSRIKGDGTMPLVAVIDVTDGDNEIHVKADRLAAETWWVSNNHLTPAESKPDLSNVLFVAFGSGDGAPAGRMQVSVQNVTFAGVYIATEQWYLLILGIWLVLTGGFLVFRFMSIRRGYEARQRHLAEEGRALAEAHAATARASAAKSQFLANMSHELRTPLNAVIGYAQLLRNGQLTPEQYAKAVKTIEHSGEHLLTMITDILDIAKVEAGKLELLPAPFDIGACIASVAEMVRLRAEEKDLRFTVVLGDGLPGAVVGDQKRIRQVLINLLTNAVKFTSAGEVRLEVSCLAASDSTVSLRFAVADTGVGIPQDQIARIFHPFEQVGNAIDRSGGTGLGLSITQHIVQMMGGEIHVESTPGQGSRFIVDLPFAQTADAALPDSHAGRALARPVDLLHISAGELISGDGPDGEPFVAPGAEVMATLLAFAREGNLRAIRREIPAIVAAGPQYKPFADRLDALAATYQSPAVLRLIETHIGDRRAA